MELNSVVMCWLVFAVGLGAFGFIVWKSHKNGYSSYFLLAFLCALLVVTAIFAPKITSLEWNIFGMSGKFELNKETTRRLLLQEPQIAEEITGQKGEIAIKEAIEKVDKVKNSEQLNQIIPFTSQGNVWFYPRENIMYRVENSANQKDARVQKFTLENSSKYFGK
jgi:ABC-type lipoprotein release transport system permease subunit